MNIRHVIPSLLTRPLATAITLTSLGLALTAQAGPLDQAKRIHDRIAGVPPSEDVLLQMRDDIVNGGASGGEQAALRAMDNDNFYNATLKSWAAPWTNEEFNVFVPLNDYIATVIGAVRDGDNFDFRRILYDDVIYVGASNLNLPAYSDNDNDHYQQLEESGASLKDSLVQASQSATTKLPANATAGVVTSRAAAKAFFKDGTNRANFRFTLLNHLCMDLEQVHDVTRIPDRIRQDVSRSPGGDARVYLNNCLGCHAGMDPMAQAFAYYDYDYAESDPDGVNGAIEYLAEGMTDPDTGSRVQKKYRINSGSFPKGYETPDDHWTNYWRQGQNSVLEWDWNEEGLPGEGSGARTMLQELASTKAFASCQVKKVFKTICLRDPLSSDLTQIESMTQAFKDNNFNIRTVFAQSANYCKGE